MMILIVVMWPLDPSSWAYLLPSIYLSVVLPCVFDMLSCTKFPRVRNLTQRQRQLIEEFAKEERREDDKGAAAGASG